MFSHLIFKQRAVGSVYCKFPPGRGIIFYKRCVLLMTCVTASAKKKSRKGKEMGGTSGCTNQLQKQRPALFSPLLVNAEREWAKKKKKLTILSHAPSLTESQPPMLRDTRLRFVERENSLVLILRVKWKRANSVEKIGIILWMDGGHPAVPDHLNTDKPIQNQHLAFFIPKH